MYNNYDINSDSIEIEEDKSNEINDNIDNKNSINFSKDNIIEKFSKKNKHLLN